MKRILTIVLCMGMLLSLGLTVFAAEGPLDEAPEQMNPEPAQETLPVPVPFTVPEPEAEKPEEPEIKAEETAAAAVAVNNPTQAVVIAIEAPATLKHLTNGERFEVIGESDEFGGSLIVTNGTITAYVDKRWSNYFKVAGNGQSKYDGTEVFLVMFKMGTIVDIVERGETTSTVIVDGMEAEIENRFLLFPDQVPYSQWTGYTRVGAKVYDNPWLRGQPEKFPNKNTQYTVIADMGNCYLINSGDYFGYIPKADITANPTVWKMDEVSSDSSGLPAEWTPPAS